MDTVGESALKVDSGRKKSLAVPGTQTYRFSTEPVFLVGGYAN